jgi:hypothetical protein
MRESLESHTPGTAPDVDEITARLGEISYGAQEQAASDDTGDLPAGESARAGGRRRRGGRAARREDGEG